MGEEKEYLCLKWGTLKEWHLKQEETKKLIREYEEIGSCLSAMVQEDTPRQKEIILEIIDKGNFDEVYMDWDSEYVSKEKAKEYIINYKF